ncbi:MAG: hypothetical protein K6B13_13155 [Prevotella sp.]|nr:hypothetical protein [Prevotella sp.]
MRKVFILLLAAFCCFSAYSQNDNIKRGIKLSLNDFFRMLTNVNDVGVDKCSPATIAEFFKGENYGLLVNGQETTIERFVTSYCRSDLQNKLVNHTLQFSLSNITKTSTSASDKRWTVKGKLIRENGTGEDYLIKDEDITIIVKWNGSDKDVSVLDIRFSRPLKIVRPVTNREYKFEIDRPMTVLKVPYYGGKWKIAIQSWFRDVKSYSGIPDKTTVGKYYLSPFTYTASRYLKVSETPNPQSLYGSLARNYSKKPRTYNVTITQTKTGKKIPLSIIQDGRPFGHFGFNQIDLVYSLKYQFGLSYMHTFEDSRFSLGVLAAMNFDTFRGVKSWLADVETDSSYGSSNESSRSSKETVTVSEYNGYKVITETINPEKTNYSEVMDPYGEAKHYTSRSLFLAQAGINVSEWMRFDLGIGAASARDLYHMEHAYALDIYKYEKQSASLPDIDNVYVYRNKYKDYYYKDRTTWGFAVRPSINFQIPVDRNAESFLTLGTGYTYVVGMEDASSFDFSIGIRWEP